MLNTLSVEQLHMLYDLNNQTETKLALLKELTKDLYGEVNDFTLKSTVEVVRGQLKLIEQNSWQLNKQLL